MPLRYFMRPDYKAIADQPTGAVRLCLQTCSKLVKTIKDLFETFHDLSLPGMTRSLHD